MSPTTQSVLLERLGEVLRSVAQREILGRFQKLAPHDVMSKPSQDDPTDLVTAADRAAEAELGVRLRELVPGSSIVGEEAVAADPSVLERLRGSIPVWVVDPLDGTTNFAHGLPIFCSSLALEVHGRAVVAAVYDPNRRELFTAERGAERSEPRSGAPAGLARRGEETESPRCARSASPRLP